MIKKAFTLIELLVVIAIIAILAAILFPVFAQAKAAAKQTANLSNVKNLALGVLMYSSDADDSFPLAQRTEGTNAAFFGLEPWQVSTQPYIKSWGIFTHPLGPAIPTGDAALAAWRQTLQYGVMARAANLGRTTYQASTSVGSFARRVCGSQPCKYDGLFGNGCDPTQGCPWYPGGVSTPSLTTTAVGNPADMLLLSEGAMWDLWSGVGVDNPCTYGVYWNPAQYTSNGKAAYQMACPSARKNPKAQSPDGACTPANLCDGYDNFGIQNGMTTYAATDGHAVAKDYRGGLNKTKTLSDGSVILTGMYPGGF